jgi:hypothetical protein
LARAIAALDTEHERGSGGAAETQAYQARRAELKRRLSQLLARRSAGT